MNGKVVKAALPPFDARRFRMMKEALGIAEADIVRIALRKLYERMETNGWKLDFREPAAEQAKQHRHGQR